MRDELPTSAPIARRHWIRLVLAGGPWLAYDARAEAIGSTVAAGAIDVGLIAPDTGTDAAERSGLALGVQETEHLAKLLGATLTFVREVPDAGPISWAIAVVAGGPDEAVAVAQRAPGVPIVATQRGTYPGTLFCVTVASHLEDPRDPVGAAPPLDGDAVDWDPRLRRYGAAQLNERYERATGHGMNEQAWRGWMACKVAAEYALRRDASATADALFDMAFDGHKGRPLSFDRGHRHLTQPMYRLAAGATAAVELRPREPGR